MRKNGFTIIEIVVVITIILILAAMLIPLVGRMQTRSRFYVTGGRIGDLQARFSRLASEHGSAAQFLQRQVLGGAIAFRHVGPVLQVSEGSWLNYDQPWQLRQPWGRPALTWEKPGIPLFAPPRNFALSQLNPRLTPQLMAGAEICSSEEFLASRRAQNGWNDAWGQPLIIGVALYQYGPDTATSWPDPGFSEAAADTPAFSHQWADAQKYLGRMRSVTVSIGSLGPIATIPNPRTTLLSPDPLIREAAFDTWWQHVITIAGSDASGELWRVAYTDAAPQPSQPTTVGINAQRDPPWKGLRQVRRNGAECMLSAPIDVP